MPITLEQARQLTTDKVDLAVIDEFRRSPLIDLITFDDTVTAPTGGDTLTYAYTRLVSPSAAAFRALNSEYAPTEATVERHSADLKVLGGSYQVDRVIARMGAGAANNVTLQMNEKIKATREEFSDAVINGDSGTNADAFDGLSKALAGTNTEIATGTYDWSGPMTDSAAWTIIEAVDDIIGHMDGDPSVLIGNKATINKIKAAVRRTNQYTETVGPLGTVRAQYGSATLVDAGTRAGSGEAIIPITAGLTDLYAVRMGLDGFHGASTVGGSIIRQWLPDFTNAGAVQTGEVELGPVGVVLKRTKAAAVARGIRLAAA